MRALSSPVRSGIRQRSAGTALTALAALALFAALARPVAVAHANPLRNFVDRTLADGRDVRDSLASHFNPSQLPLIAAALAAAPDSSGVSPERVYRALARWHFWSGRRWDVAEQGLWAVDPSTVPVGAAGRGQVLAAHASLELVQLAALARLASASGNHYDALVWWTDHERLRTRMVQRLYDPVRGLYSDLDSTGAAIGRPSLDTLVPLAFGAPAIAELARTAAWRMWAASEPGAEASSAARVHAIERADALHGWSEAPGSRLFEPKVMGALIHAGVRTLGDPSLELLVRDALGTVGLTPPDSIPVRLGSWTPRLAVREVAPLPFERARTGVIFLDRAGVLEAGELDSLLVLLDLARDAERRAESVAALTTRLAHWRALDPKAERFLWQHRRDGRPRANGEHAVFRQQDGDVTVWVEHALDCITEDVIAFHLRRNDRAPWRAAVNPPVAGRGDRVTLELHSDGPLFFEPGQRFTVQAVWTDGLRLLDPRAVEIVAEGERHARGELGLTPETNGLWRLVLEGMPANVRVPAAVAVVDPVQLRVVPLDRRGRTATVRVEVVSQIRERIRGRVEAQPPLTFTALPGTTIEYELDGEGSQSWDLDFRPATDDGPALYPVRWQLFDAEQRIGGTECVIAVPFEWLRLGPLPERPGSTIDTPLPPDEQVRLAQRFRGITGEEGWNRMPAARESADGWVRMADGEEAAGIHYAFTAFTTGSREAHVRLQADGPAILTVNRRVVARTPEWGGLAREEISFGPGTNYVLVKLAGGDGRPGRFRLDLRDIDGQPLRGVVNTLDMLLDEMAYLARTEEMDERERAIGRESLRLMPFTYVGPEAESVSVVGSFNGWSPTVTRMVRLEDGRWQAKVRLRPGRFEYKFAVDGDHWIADPANPEAVDDGFGGRNSVLVVE